MLDWSKIFVTFKLTRQTRLTERESHPQSYLSY